MHKSEQGGMMMSGQSQCLPKAESNPTPEYGVEKGEPEAGVPRDPANAHEISNCEF